MSKVSEEVAKISENIARIRRKRGISQETLAKKVDKSKQSIYLLEKGEIQRPNVETIQKIAEALEVSITELLKK